ERVEQVVVVRGQRERLEGSPVEGDFHRAANVGRALLGGKQDRAQRHDGGLRGTPRARRILLRGYVGERLGCRSRFPAPLEQRLGGQPGGLHGRAGAAQVG